MIGLFDTMNAMSTKAKSTVKSDRIIFWSMCALCFIGFLMSISASMTSTVTLTELLGVAFKQTIFLIIGFSGYVFFSKTFKLSFIKNHIVTLSVLMIISLIIPLFFSAINGAHAWIHLPLGLSIQPAEFAKIGMILVITAYLANLKNESVSAFESFKMPLFILITSLFIIIVLQRDFGSALVLALISLFVFMVASYQKLFKWQIFGLILMMILISVIILFLTEGGLAFLKSLHILKEYQLKRFEDVLNPFLNRYGTGYQLINSLVAFVKGQWRGVGFGLSLQKYGYLPAAKTDYILAIIAEENGFLGLCVTLGITLLIGYRLFYYAFKVKEDFMRMILVGSASYLIIHFILNVGGVSALIPMTGVPLLLISSGGSSTISMMAMLGISQKIIKDYRQSR